MKEKKRSHNNKRDTYRILAADKKVNNNTWITGLNNNDIIIGPSGAGKTRGYVIPNILQCNESMIIADTKGSLCKSLWRKLISNGYCVKILDFTDCYASSCGYNPLDHIKYDKKRDQYNEQDIKTIAAALVPQEQANDPFWHHAARVYLESIIAYVMECLPEEEHNLSSIMRLFGLMGSWQFGRLYEELSEINPKSYAAQLYQMYYNNAKAEKMHESIRGILGEKLSVFALNGVEALSQKQNKVDFREMGKHKTAVFLNISDTDRSMDRLANLFYTQAMHELCDSADKDYPEHRLDVPVRFILDDFAANVYIPDFDNITSVIRSREVSVSIILQSLSQLEALYGSAKAKTILNNCDHCLYLGGQDVETARYISCKANKSINTILNMPLSEAWLFERGSEPGQVRKYRLKDDWDKEDYDMAASL